jgi:TPR repeat protein
MKKLLRISVGICLTFCVFLTASAQGGSEVCADHESRIKAEQGDSNAQIMLGFCYHSAGNSKQEVFWYHKSAEQGNSMA